ncbi:hypothetical protein M407DRAFT_9706 [Tulasnella calospora MUT 4182]|uniref:Uncharacterized protein n=1 Tax=Tulasnella calospora MUT 4182 TaxID=1051891 RepID=A0A0C3KNH0_9AGAM|nr:hypothetical protein M407DRAFT_9706 [Tulasnella calospora MUT 4182]
MRGCPGKRILWTATAGRHRANHSRYSIIPATELSIVDMVRNNIQTDLNPQRPGYKLESFVKRGEGGSAISITMKTAAYSLVLISSLVATAHGSAVPRQFCPDVIVPTPAITADGTGVSGLEVGSGSIISTAGQGITFHELELPLAD